MYMYITSMRQRFIPAGQMRKFVLKGQKVTCLRSTA